MHRKVEQNNGTDCAIYTIEYFKEALYLFLKMEKFQTNKNFKWWDYLIKECNKNNKYTNTLKTFHLLVLVPGRLLGWYRRAPAHPDWLALLIAPE